MLLWKVGRLNEAEASLRGAIDDLESQRSKLGGSEETWSIFAAGFTDYYKDLARLLMELHREQDAFLILERFRAGAFLRTLAQRDLAAPAEVPDDLDRELRMTNAEYDRTQGALRALNPRDDEKKIDQRLTRLAELRQKRAEIEERIKRASPRYGALRYPQPLDFSATRAVLDPGTLLLSYSVGEEETFLFVVSGDSTLGPPLTAFRLPVGDNALRGSVEAFRRLIGRNKPSRELLARGRALYDTLLGPAEALIGKHDRLLILSDGPLHTIPWAALVRSVKSDQPQYLVEWKPIHTAVSATVYAELKKTRREGPKSAAVQVAAFGDPKYPALAARPTAAKRGGGTEEVGEDAYGDAEVDAVLRGGYRFEPLPRSRQEVEAIAGLYAPKSEAFLGEQATEERALSIGKGVSLIHYACHAYVNERFPLDSALVFTIPEQAEGGPGERPAPGLGDLRENAYRRGPRHAIRLRLRPRQGDGRRGADRPDARVPVRGGADGPRFALEGRGRVHGGADEALLRVSQGRQDEGRGPAPGADRPDSLVELRAAARLGGVRVDGGLEIGPTLATIIVVEGKRMARTPVMGFTLALVATLGASSKPPAAEPGIVVETVEQGYEAANAGIQPGDVLRSWERPANPPANPEAAMGLFRSPFDVFEVEIEQAPRARTTTVVLTREGKRISTPILQFQWRVETRPAFSSAWLARYEQGKQLVDAKDLAGGTAIWQALAGDLSAASRHSMPRGSGRGSDGSNTRASSPTPRLLRSTGPLSRSVLPGGRTSRRSSGTCRSTY